LRIIIDGDACPVINNCIALARKYQLECLIIIDTSHQINSEYARVIIVDKGNDSVDYYLVNMLKDNDIVITQDYGLASMCLSYKCIVLNQNGLRYDIKNINALLMQRAISQKIRKSGKRVKGPSKRTIKDNNDFDKSLEEVILLNINK
jgi:uncharacterized protein YaiI (UPF0178 family)